MTSTAHIRIRPADLGVASDIELIHRIRCREVREGTAYWEETEPSLSDTSQWIADHLRVGVVLIAEATARDQGSAGRAPSVGAEALGFAALGVWSSLSGYAHTREVSVYVVPEAQGRGVGRALMSALIEQAPRVGVHTLVSAIEAENHASVRLHQACGFEIVGTARHMGRKFGRWLDLTIMQLVF